MKSLFVSALILLTSCSLAAGQDRRSPDDQVHISPKKLPQPDQPQPEKQEQTGESSSKDSQLNLEGPSKGSVGSGAQELRPYDPHKAAKDVEVGQFYLKHKNYRAALDRFNEALLYKPNDAEATFYLAATQDRLELYDLAYKNYRSYVTLLPEGPFAKQAQEALTRIAPRLNSPQGRQRDSEQARQLVQEGETCLAKNDFESAHTSFVKALQILPDDPVANFRVAESLQGLQRLDEARIFYRKYLSLQPNGKMAAEAKRQISEINFTLGK